MLKAFKDFINNNDLFEGDDRIMLAVSGGLDSMVMAALFRETTHKIAVAHCNFQLRQAESDEDEEFVKQFCGHAGIPFFSKRFDTKNYAEELGISIQMAARELRYEWFNELLGQEKYHWLATAHHLNDNIETVLFRWTQGAGLDQLRGIPAKNDKIVRPLLFATREQLAAYAKEKMIKWREDASNATEDYHRNFIRHQVVPKLKEINPSLEETFTHSLEKANGAFELMQRGLGQLKDDLTSTDDRRFNIDKNLLMLLRNPEFVCYEWLKLYDFDWDRCCQLVKAIGGQPGKIFYSPTHQAVIDREHIIVTAREEWQKDILIEDGQDKAALGPWLLTLSRGDAKKLFDRPGGASVDRDRIKFPLIWRKWKRGDFFFPLGLGHRKKLSDYLVDEKVSMADKSVVTVLETGGEIVWVVGHRLDDRFKVTPATRSVLEIRVESLK
jgi:tRNA(Ile)-lysidine synthase